MSGHNVGYELLIAGHVPTDPGDGGALTVDRSPVTYELVTTGAETRTLPDPVKSGLLLVLSMKTDGGDCVVTADTAINAAANTIMTFDNAGDSILLWSIPDGATAWKWKVMGNDGVALS